MPPSADVFNLEHSVDLVIAFRKHILTLVKICPWLKQARVIDRTNILEAKLLRKSQPPDVLSEGDDLVDHVKHKSTAGHIGIQSGPNKGLGDDVCGASLYNFFIRTLRAGQAAPGTFASDQSEGGETGSPVRCETSPGGKPHLLIVRIRPTILNALPCPPTCPV